MVSLICFDSSGDGILYLFNKFFVCIISSNFFSNRSLPLDNDPMFLLMIVKAFLISVKEVLFNSLSDSIFLLIRYNDIDNESNLSHIFFMCVCVDINNTLVKINNIDNAVIIMIAIKSCALSVNIWIPPKN